MSLSKARQAQYVLAVMQGLIVDAFEPTKWMEATAKNFPGRDAAPGRIGFEGKPAPDEIHRLYVDKRVPQQFRKTGAANPVKYTWK
jgi:hypothetical protein